MAPPENTSSKPVSTPTPEKKKDLSGYLRAVDVDRLKSPANSAEKPLLLKTQINRSRKEDMMNVRLLQATGVLVSAIWLGGAALYVQRSVGWANVSQLMPHELGGFLAGILAPIALFWMIAAFVLRSNDVKMYAEALREEIQRMIFPSEAADRRVNNDIERLMRQTSEMSKATRIALNSIEAAREGLKSQVSMLNDNSEETAHRLANLSTTLQDRMKDAASMLADLEKTTAAIEARTLKSNQSWADMVSDVGAKVDQTEEKLNTSRTQLETALAKMDQTGTQIQEKIASTNTSTEIAVARLSEMLRQRLESLGNLHQETESALQRAADEMATQRQELRIEAEAIEEKAYGISDALQKSTTKLYEFSDDALDKAKLIESRLVGQSASLEHIMSSAVDNAQKIADSTDASVEKLQQVAGQTTTALQNVAQETIARLQDVANEASEKTDKIGNVLQTAIERLEDRAQSNLMQVQQTMGDATSRLIADVDSVSERAKVVTDNMLNEVNRKVVDTTSAFAYIQKQIQSLVGLFDQRKMDLDGASESARQTAETLHQTLQLALDKVQDTTRALQSGIGSIQQSVQQPIALLENVATLAHQKAGDIGQLLENKAGSLKDIAMQMGDHVQAMEQQFHTKGQDVALLAGKIAGHLKSVSIELEQQNTMLDTRIGQSVQALETMGNAQKAIVDNLGKLQDQTALTTEQSAVSAEVIQQRVSLLQQLHKALAEEAEQSNEKLGRVSDRLVSISTSTVDKIKNSIENMTLLEADYHRLSEAGIDEIGLLEQGYRRALENIQSETKNTAEQIAALHDGIEEKTRDAKHAMELQLQSLRDTSDNVGATTRNITDIGLALDHQVVRIQELGNSAQGTLQQVMTMAQTLDERVAHGNNQVSIHVKSIQDAITQIQDHTLHAVEAFVQQEQTLEQQMEVHASKFDAVNEKMVHSSQNVRDSLAQTVTISGELTDKLSTQLERFTKDAQQAETLVSGSVSRLLSQNEQIKDSANLVVERLGEAHQGMVQQNRDLQNTGDDMLERLQQATQQISTKAAALEQAAQEARKQAELLREQETKLNRDAFFNSTKFVVESLHSLALDFTRLLEGELPEKTWRNYQRGDVGSFTRHLLSSRDKDTQNKINTKFKDDVEFRTYVQRYLRQFEEIFDSAASNDHADLLATVFNTSDVGKLYNFLCNALEREPRTSARR